MRKKRNKVIHANSIILSGEDGASKIDIGVSDDCPSITLASKGAMLQLTINNGMPQIRLCRKGNILAALLIVGNEGQNPILAFYDEKGRFAFRIGHWNENDPTTVTLFDKEGEDAWSPPLSKSGRRKSKRK